MPAPQQEIAKDLTEDFSLFEDWEERYRYIIELGDRLPNLAETHRTEVNRVQGCTSNAWLVAARDPQSGLITFSADSDSQIVRGLIGILLMLFSERQATEILDFDVAPLFQELTLHQHLSPSRANGLNSLVRTLKELTLRYIEAAT